jgi:hypothetical protein
VLGEDTELVIVHVIDVQLRRSLVHRLFPKASTPVSWTQPRRSG